MSNLKKGMNKENDANSGNFLLPAEDNSEIVYAKFSARIDKYGHVNEAPISPDERMRLLFTLPCKTKEDLRLLGLLFNEDE